MKEPICKAITKKGKPCRTAPLKEGEFCFFHTPGIEAIQADARRRGAFRRRKERIIGDAFDFKGLGTIPAIRRLLDIATADTLELPSSIQRNRLLGTLA